MGDSQNYGYPFGGPYNKDYNILGSTLGSPHFGKLPKGSGGGEDPVPCGVISLRRGGGPCLAIRKTISDSELPTGLAVVGFKLCNMLICGPEKV